MFEVPTILFVSTVNVCRSRFAEALFNHHAQEKALGWCAFSRGLKTQSSTTEGLDPNIQAALHARNIEPHHTANNNAPLTTEDLEMATIIIALSKDEHRPMVLDQFPDWIDQFNFWEAEDSHLIEPQAAFPIIEHEVEALLADLITASKA